MSGTTHDMKWRLLVGAAPVIGVAFFVWSAAQGPSDVARSPTARAILALVAALGAGVAWWTARQLRATPSVTVSRASARAIPSSRSPSSAHPSCSLSGARKVLRRSVVRQSVKSPKQTFSRGSRLQL